jgi:hypothetical protein
MALDYKNSLSRYRRYLQTIQSQPLLGPGLWTVFSLLLLMGMLLFALKPTLVTISSLLGQIEQRKTVSAALDRKIYSLQQASDQLNKVKDRLGLLDQAIPQISDWNTLTRKFEGVATESGVELTKIEFKDISVLNSTPSGDIVTNLPQGTSSVAFTITGTGEYASMRTMIERLEKIRRILVVSKSQIYRDQMGGLNMLISGEAGFIPLERD